MKKTLTIIALAAMMTACGSGSTKEQGTTQVATPEAVVTSTTEASAPSEDALGMGTIRTIGKVVAERFADLSFETALPIEKVLVKNGQRVRRGQVLAQLDVFKLRNAVEQQQKTIDQVQLQIEQARLQMQDVIISQGYDPDKESQVPANVMHNADVKSGYALAKSQLATAQTQLAAAEHELRSGVLTAPFDGIIANLSVQAHQLAQAGQIVCRVIDNESMSVEFRVMESDLGRYKLGTAVTVVPVADQSKSYAATISEINPIVDEQGAITLRAHLANAANLFDGMNVEVGVRD